ncbi:hypothetical protein BD410DRAFT_807036 [Rickenella mellea]|uniref:Uncharacterized protein n=1 Tax=Rickenella mellea TaxID=50990 RepID=A0A4Y7PRX7_9AGAM|nr:hypothetical protein BD410DRAFT_807036 [Rickenella mellea]
MAHFPPITSAQFSVRSTVDGVVQNNVDIDYTGHQYTHHFLHTVFTPQLVTPVYNESVWSSDDFCLHIGFAWALHYSLFSIGQYILAAAHGGFDPSWGENRVLPSYVPPEFYESMGMPPPPPLAFRSHSDNPLLVHGTYAYLEELVREKQQLGLKALAWIAMMKRRCMDRKDVNWSWPWDPSDMLAPTPSHNSSRSAKTLRRNQRRRERRKRQQEVHGPHILPSHADSPIDISDDEDESWANVVTPWDNCSEISTTPPPSIDGCTPIEVDEPTTSTALILHPVFSNHAIANNLSAVVPFNGGIRFPSTPSNDNIGEDIIMTPADV